MGTRIRSPDMPDVLSDGAKLQDYEAFIAIVETGNLTRAAARLRRSLQSVSRSLSALEAQLGVILVRRTTRTAVPTETGLAFHQRVKAALRELSLAEAEVSDTSGVLRGTLRVAGSAFFVSDYVIPIIRDFSLQYPSVKFDLRISEEFAEPLRAGVDLMIRLGPLAPSRMKSRKLASLRRVAVASPQYLAQRGRPETPAALARHACIIRTSAQDAREWTFQAEDGGTHRVAVQGVLEADNAFVTMHAALAGMGIAVMPLYHARRYVEAGRVEIILDDFTLAPTSAHAVWPPGSRMPTRLGRFVDFLAQRLKREVI